ncbi:MAG: uroporphyrinogen decarboxylase family protein [Planctomycetota bacterium]
MMNSIDVVRNSIRFQAPERLPFTGNMSETDFSGDTVAIFPDMGSAWWLGDGGTDEWGCEWEVDPDHKDMGQVKNIVLKDVNDYNDLKVPDASDPKRYGHWPEIIERAEKEKKYVVICNGSFIFERFHFLHGFEDTLIDILAEPETVKKALRHIVEYHLATVKYIKDNFSGRIHGYRGTDDWGSQQSLLISPDAFADVFKPIYTDIFSAIHDAGMDAWMHSCGQIFDVMNHLIDAGLNVVNVMQPNIFPIPELAKFKGKINFEVCADTQTTLPGGNQESAAAEIRGLVESCCNDKGGLIEVKLNRMHYDGENIPEEMGLFCHNEYQKNDPFLIKNS